MAIALGCFFAFSCQQKGETVQEEDTTSEQILEGEETPSQYQGSTGVDDASNVMDADENIELKKQEFKGSFASAKTQSYTFTVLEAKEYTFTLESADPAIRYLVNKADGTAVIHATKDKTSRTLEPGEYKVLGVIDSLSQPEDTTSGGTSDSEFTVIIE